MNALENWFCATSFWRNVTRHKLLPWLLQGYDHGDRVLELGAGFGAATAALQEKFSAVTSLEYSGSLAAKLASRARESRHGEASRSVSNGQHLARVVQGDAAQLPFADASFTCAVAILMLHHLPSTELQNASLAEAFRVLRPGGMLVALEIHAGWLQRLVHTRSTFLPFPAAAANARLNAVGFARVSVDFFRGGFVLRAQRAAASRRS
jgi:ubiquinone/menaquinone biosynthesis C-methylase UbiE